jgi:hypothetical protein
MNEGLLLRYLDEEAARVAMGEVHEGLCDTHQSAVKMRWILKRLGVYWPTMLEDCVRYKKGCKACQKFGEIQPVLASELCPIIKPWPFSWGLDFIGEIHPSSSKGYRFVLVATDYFTKWTEVVPLRNMTHKELIEFVQGHIIHRFGIPQTMMTDQGSSFMSHQFREFVRSFNIKLMNSSPYYAQANRQAKSNNRTLIRLVKKKIEDYPRRWHEVLSEVLWAYRTSQHSATKVTPFELVYGQEAILLVEINLQTCRVAKLGALSAEEYTEAMMDRIDNIQRDDSKHYVRLSKKKRRVAKAYNKRVKKKVFQIGELVWKLYYR